MTMMKRMCSCSVRRTGHSHFDSYVCSGCGERFGCFWPKIMRSPKDKPFKFCPFCGDPFGRIKDPDKLEEYQP